MQRPEKARALLRAITWFWKKLLSQGITLQDNKGESLDQFMAEVRFAGSGQAADYYEGGPDDRFRELLQAFQKPLRVVEHFCLGHTLIIKRFA